MPLQSPASQREREREGEPQIAIASNTIAESTPSLPPSFIHSICKHRAIPCLRNQLSLAEGGGGRRCLSLWPTTKERARAMIDFFFARTKLSMSHMGEELEVHLSSVLTHHGFDIHDKEDETIEQWKLIGSIGLFVHSSSPPISPFLAYACHKMT